MDELVLRKRRLWLSVLGISLLLLGYLAWGLFTISYQSEVFEWLAFGVALAVIGGFEWVSCSCAKLVFGDGVREQWCAVCGIVAVCGILLISRGGSDLWRQQNFCGLLLGVLWCGVCGYNFFLLLDRDFFSENRIKNFIKKHGGILLLLAVTFLFCFEPDAFQYRWDGLLYYLTCKELSLKSLSSLAIYGHIAQTFGALVEIGNIIFKNTGISLLAVNIFLMLLSIVYFYAILEYCLPGRRQWIYVLLTAIYAWSPYLLGMVPYYNLDFACQCLVVPVIYYLMKKKWILFLFFSFLFCFTKEPAILVYGALCTAHVIVDMINDRGISLGRRVKNCFGRKRYYFMVMPGILWMATYKILGPWSAGNGGVGFDLVYVINKLKNLYILNFNWVFSGMVLWGIMLVLCKKDHELGKKIMPLLFAQAAFTMFSCFFKTVNHPRYNDTNQVTLYLLAVILICTYRKEITCISWSILLSILLLISSFYTVDPISLYLYPTYQVGGAVMLTSGGCPLGDSMVYNRQMLGMEKALEMALRKAIQDRRLVCFPAVNNNPYYFDGMSAVGSIDECQIETEYWDAKGKVRVPERRGDTIEFMVCHIPEKIDWEKVDAVIGNQADLIYMDCAGKQCYEEMRKYYSVVEEEEYTYKGWTVYRARIRKE